MLQIDVCETVKLSSESTFEFSGNLSRAFTHHQKSSYLVANKEKFHWFLDATIYHMRGKPWTLAKRSHTHVLGRVKVRNSMWYTMC